MKKLSPMMALLPVVVLIGCNMKTISPITPSSPDAAYTQAAQTVAAELTRVSSIASPTSNAPTSTFTPSPTNTTVFTPTNTPIPCNLATYDPATIDVTVPDNTPMAPNQVFGKTWRIRNAGTCSWNSSYQLIFDHGDGMGVTPGYAQALTTGVVNPGQTVDLTVNLTAPATSGTYTGAWRLRDPGGVVFGITPAGGTFVVIIKVTSPPTTVTLNPIVGESGTIRSDGGPWPDFTAGESNADITRTCEAFLSFDITGIPSNATITEVKVNLTAYTTTGDPFVSLGVLNMYATDYGLTLEPADFVAGLPPGNIADWGSAGALSVIEASPELKSFLQSKVGSGRLQFRLQFGGSNMDPVKDRITFTSPSVSVTYTKP